MDLALQGYRIFPLRQWTEHLLECDNLDGIGDHVTRSTRQPGGKFMSPELPFNIEPLIEAKTIYTNSSGSNILYWLHRAATPQKGNCSYAAEVRSAPSMLAQNVAASALDAI